VADEPNFHAEDAALVDAHAHLVWLAVYRSGPAEEATIRDSARIDEAACEKALADLVNDGRVRKITSGGVTRYATDRFEIPLGASRGWEAAVLDHFQAMVAAITSKLRQGSLRGGGQAEAGVPCDISFQDLDPTPVSFTTDVMPIFGFGCALSDCHNSNDAAPRAGLQAGPKCRFDPNAGQCGYPATAPPNGDPITSPQPLTPQTVQAVYANLLLPATTVSGGSVQRVVPGHPEESFLLMKLSNTQALHGYTCVNQDTSHEGGDSAPPCGVGMPGPGPGAASLCEVSSPGTSIEGQPAFDIVARWIAQGAPAN
jgi:hypothetical protein